MDKESIDIKTAIQIAKIVASVPEERMPIIWDIFKQAGLDIGGIDEMAEWKALTKQTALIDTGEFLAGITAGKEPVSGELELSDMKVHTDDGGNVKAIELKYMEKEPEKKVPENHPWA